MEAGARKKNGLNDEEEVEEECVETHEDEQEEDEMVRTIGLMLVFFIQTSVNFISLYKMTSLVSLKILKVYFLRSIS